MYLLLLFVLLIVFTLTDVLKQRLVTPDEHVVKQVSLQRIALVLEQASS